eukprot:gene23506-6318_t
MAARLALHGIVSSDTAPTGKAKEFPVNTEPLTEDPSACPMDC